MIVAGVCIDHLGLVRQTRTVDAPAGSPLNYEIQRSFTALPGTDIAHQHPATIPIDQDHDEHTIGLVEHLHRDPRGSIWAIGWIDDNADVDLEQAAYSASVRRYPPDQRWQIDSVAITTSPAMTCLGKLTVLDAPTVRDITDSHVVKTRKHDPYLASVLQVAHRTARARRAGQPIIVAHDEPTIRHAPGFGDWPTRGNSRADSKGIWYGQPTRIISVR